jgi:chemotaxis protein CheD
MPPQRHMVGMAQSAVSARAGDTLVSLGLGSCIGLALIDASSGVAGLAHIVLPSSAGAPNVKESPASKHADTAVPALLQALVGQRARRSQIEAVMCGGASMFGGGASATMQIGARNADSTRQALRSHGIRIRAEDTGGGAGRSVEVDVATGRVSVRTQGSTVTL